MLDKFNTWKYRADHNCWDFVREYLIERYNVPSEDVPKYGICPRDKKSMHEAHLNVIPTFRITGPQDGSIAAQYIGKTIFHVGIVDKGHVLHTGEKTGNKREKIKQFESVASKVIYYTHKSLLSHGNS